VGTAENDVDSPRGVRQELPATRQRAADPAHPPSASRESEVRLRVLKAASALVDRLSYDEVTIDAVARASGVSKSTLYRHWPSRQILVLEAFTYKTNLLTHVEDTGDVRRDLHSYLVALTRCLDEGQTASTVSNLLAEAIRSTEFSRLYRQTGLPRESGLVRVCCRTPDPRPTVSRHVGCHGDQHLQPHRHQQLLQGRPRNTAIGRIIFVQFRRLPKGTGHGRLKPSGLHGGKSPAKR
jgi:AcrR family transcriptional regulator